MAKKAVKKTSEKTPSKESMFKKIERKEHEINWKVVGKIAVFSLIAYIVMVLVLNYSLAMSKGFTWILINSIKTAILVVAVILFIIGFIAVSENTTRK